MSKKPHNHGKDWTPSEVWTLKLGALTNRPAEDIAKDVGRTEAATRAKASREKQSLNTSN